MKINLSKTKITKLSRQREELDKIIDEVEIEQVEEFCYLRRLIDANVRRQKETKINALRGKKPL